MITITKIGWTTRAGMNMRAWLLEDRGRIVVFEVDGRNSMCGLPPRTEAELQSMVIDHYLCMDYHNSLPSVGSACEVIEYLEEQEK